MVNATCCVYGCLSTSKNNKDLKFHRFPRDDRSQLWIAACRRADLKDKSLDQLYNMHVCSSHFEQWMYMKTKLKSAAIPVLNLPSASLHSISTQTGDPDVENFKSFHDQKQFDIPTFAISSVISLASTTAQKSENTKKLTIDSPRKRKFQKQNVICEKKMKLLQNPKPMEIARQKFLRGCDKFLSPNLSKIVKAEIDLKPRSKNDRYSNEFKLFCINIYCSSPRAYNFLSKTSSLPSKLTLATATIPVSTKISEYVLDILSQAIKNLLPFERECTLCLGVLSLKCSLFHDTQRDKIIGLHEIDDIQEPFAAGYAFTMMLRGISGNWKQVLGYSFIKSNKIDETLKEWIINTVKQLFGLGFKIRAIVSDQGSDFLKFARTMEVSKEHPHFKIDGKKVYYIFDVPRLITSVRNNLMKYNFESNDKTASWDDIYKCYKFDKEKDIRCAPKLTESHISPNSFQKQKVRLATQVLSQSVKTALETYNKSGDLISCNGTIEFIDIMDKLFDVLTSNSIYSTNPYKKAYRDNKIQQNLLFKAQNVLCNLIVKNKDTGKDVTSSIKFINAFSITINAIIQLYDDLKNESGVDEFYLQTRSLTTDNLELFFEQVCHVNDNCWKPTCIQFERAFRKSLLCQFIQLCNLSNCNYYFDNILSRYCDFVQNNVIFTKMVTHQITQRRSKTNFDIPKQNSFMYVCCYLLRRCLGKHKCVKITKYASTFTDDSTASKYKSKFNNLYDSYGGVPPADFIVYCNELEVNFKRSFRSCVGNNILNKLYELLNTVKFKSQPCSCFPRAFLIKLFIRMQLYHIVKFNNTKMMTSRSKMSRKCLDLQHDT